MSREFRRSTLQAEILGYLRADDAPSITSLADALGKSRPSVSRSLHILKDQGLVLRAGRSWSITEEGRAAADNALTRLSSSTEDMLERAVSRLDVASRLASGNLLGELQGDFLGAASPILDGSLGRSILGLLGQEALDSISIASASNAVMPELLRQSRMTAPGEMSMGEAMTNLQTSALGGLAGMSSQAIETLTGPMMMDPSGMQLGKAIDSMQASAGLARSMDVPVFSDRVSDDSPMSDMIAKLAGYADVDVAKLIGPVDVDASKLVGYSDFDAAELIGSAAATDLGDEIGKLSYLQMPDDLNRSALGLSAESAAASLLGTMAPEDVVTLDRFVGMGTDAVARMALGFSGLEGSLFGVSAADLVPALPDFEEYFADLDRAQKGAEALDRSELGFTQDIWTFGFMVQLSEVDEAEQVDWLYERVAEETQDIEYLEALAELFSSSLVLQRRWPATQAAIEDHQTNRFYSSIAVMLAQIEGLVNDILLLPGLVRIQVTKVQKIGKDGEKDRYLSGLYEKSELARKALLLEASLAGHIASRLAGERNGILHGIEPSYADIRLSTRCVLLLTMLAKTVIKAEERTKTLVA